MGAQATVNLVVDETGAVAGLTRFQQRAIAAFQGTRKETTSLNDEIRRLSASIDGLAASGVKAGNSMSDGFRKANSHALTDLDTVRLLRDDLGVRIPRAMEKLIASTEAFQAIASVAFGAFAFIGALELVTAIGSKIGEWAHDLAGDTKAVQDFHKALVEANDARLVNPGTDDQAVKNRATLMAEIKTLEDRRDHGAMNKVLTAAFANPDFLSQKEKSDSEYYSSKDDDLLQKRKAQLGELNENNAGKDRQRNAEQARELRENTEIQLEGMRKIAQARANERAEIDDKVNGTNGQDRTLTREQGEREKQLVDQKYGAQNVVLQRQYADEVRSAWQAAFVSRLQGEQKAYEETANAVKNFHEKAQRDGRLDRPGSQSSRDVYGEETAMWEKANNEKAQRQKQFAEETIKMAEQARIVESQGTARTLAEQSAAIAELARQRIAAGEQTAEYDRQWADRRVQIEAKANAEIAKGLTDYAESERRMYDDLSAGASKGYAKIAAEQKRRSDDADKEYHQKVDGLDMWDPRRFQADATHTLKLNDIQANSDTQRAELHRKALDETQNIEEQAGTARRGAHSSGLSSMLTGEEDVTAKITAEYDKRVRAAKESFDQQELTLAEYQQRVQSINDVANAQMEAAEGQMRDRLSGEIEGAFTHPMAAIRKQMEHEMAAMIAGWVMQLGAFKRIFGSTFSGTISGESSTTHGGAQQAAGPAGLISNLMSRVGSNTQASSGFGGASPALAGGGDTLGGAFAPPPSAASPSSASNYGGAFSSTGSVAPARSDTALNPAGMVSDATSLATTSTRALNALKPHADPALAGALADGPSSKLPRNADGTVDYSRISDDNWNDPSMMSSSDPNSAAYHADPTAVQPGDEAIGSVAGLAGTGVAAYSGFTGVVNAFEGGQASDIPAGAMSGAELGGAIGSLAGPEGALVGAGVGAAVGGTVALVGWATGEGNRLGAASYYKTTILPQFESAAMDYFKGTDDSEAALGTVSSIGESGYKAIASKFGWTAAGWARDHYITKEQALVTREIDQLAAGGHDYVKASAVQFHTGGLIGDFGDLRTSSNEGFIHAMLGEAVVTPTAAATHADALAAMNAGAMPSDIAGMYLRSGSGTGSTAPPSGSVTHHHLNISTLDAHSFQRFLDERGGIDAIVRSTTRRNRNYNGEAD